MSQSRHVQRGLLFIAVCVMLGVGMFLLTRRSNSDLGDRSANIAEGSSGEYQPYASAQDADPADAEKLDTAEPETGERGTDAALSPESVWTEADAGILDCQIDGKPVQVRWHREGAGNAATITINGKTVSGELVGDWQPTSNTVRFDFEGRVPEINAKLTLSDQGDLAVRNPDTDEAVEGQCRKG